MKVSLKTKSLKFFLCSFIFFFLCACASKDLGHYMPLKTQQNINALPKFTPSTALMDTQKYKKYFFSAWNDNAPKPSKKEVFWAFDGYLRHKYYFFNKRPIPKSFFEKAIINANTDAFLSLKQKAIITQTTYLKNIPVSTAILQDPFKQGEGIPFDYALDSVLNFATPVLISHYTQDKRYAFVKSEVGWGFVSSLHLQTISNAQAQHYKEANFITPLFERTLVYNDKDEFVFEGRIGAIYPYDELKNGVYHGQVGNVKFQISVNQASKFPLELNDKTLKNQLTQLINRPYGWGGYDFERDCSSLIKDIFAPFGLYLPRNSFAQSMAWEHFDISSLSNSQKINLIKRYGKPYETLLYLKGHIVLYVGVVDGKSLAFHSIWGVKTKDDGRILIGKSVITTLEIGKDDKRVKKDDLLLSRFETMSFFKLNEQEKERLKKALKKL